MKMFQHTATRRWLHEPKSDPIVPSMFQHTATRRWLPLELLYALRVVLFQHTATRRWLLGILSALPESTFVSTHSHPKVAAGLKSLDGMIDTVSTHSHPKVAAIKLLTILLKAVFQHTATRRWLHHI